MAIMTEDPNWVAFKEIAHRLPDSKCKLGKFIESLDGEHKKLVERAVSNLDLPSETLAKSLEEVGNYVSSTVIKQHRRGSCLCFREGK